MNELKIIGNTIRSIRIDQGFTQLEFAIECGIDKTNYGRIERGEVSPKVETLILISRTLNIHINNFFVNIL